MVFEFDVEPALGKQRLGIFRPNSSEDIQILFPVLPHFTNKTTRARCALPQNRMESAGTHSHATSEVHRW